MSESTHITPVIVLRKTHRKIGPFWIKKGLGTRLRDQREVLARLKGARNRLRER